MDIQRYNANFKEGLNSEQVSERIRDGLTNYCKINATKSYRQIFKDNFVTFFNLLNLVFAVLIIMTGAIKELFFLLVVIGNLGIGLAQEIVTKKTLDKLSVIVEAQVTVIRNSEKETIKVDSLVLDDIMQLKSGDQVCADANIIQGTVEVNESLITGESDVVVKTMGDFLYSGSFIVSGEVYARVERVGLDNYANKISYTAKTSKKRTSELRIALNRILKVISIIIIPLGILLFLKQGLLTGLPIADNTIKTVGALIGMIPEGLILLTSISLAASAVILATKHTLVQDLYCIETLARVDILCLDKTGTITEGKMHVTEMIPLEQGIDIPKILSNIAGALNDDNATSRAIVDKYGKHFDFEVNTLIPFSSARKYSGVSFKDMGSYFMGAFEFLFPNGYKDLDPQQYAAKGARVLVLAHSEQGARLKDSEPPRDLQPIALILISDIIREDAKQTLEFFEKQKVQIKIISGDSPITVEAIAAEAGLNNPEAVDAITLKTPEDIARAAEQYNVFGRVTPQQKQQIIAVLKKDGHTVAMAGDGVNDVQALKESDCSIAMASGSDAVKNIANVVLLNSDFANMPAIVNEGRKVINNIERVATLFITKTVYAVLLALATVIFLSSAYPYTPLQLTLISFVNIGFPAFFLALEPNFNPIKKNFLLNILKKSLPGGLAVVAAVLILNILGFFFNYPSGVLSTMCVYAATAGGMWVVVKVSHPFSTFRKIILILSIAIFFLFVFFMTGFFDIVVIRPSQLIIVLILIAVMPLFMRFIENRLDKGANAFLNRKLVKQMAQKIEEDTDKINL